jgi:diketogulonate reductase-like aldo/keto reductase
MAQVVLSWLVNKHPVRIPDRGATIKRHMVDAALDLELTDSEATKL